jgi:hypothetical protein
MDVHDLLMRLGWFFIAAIALTALLVYLGRVVLRHFLAADIQAYKQHLQMDSMLALERSKTELRRLYSDRDSRVARLQDKQAEVIAELYKRMVFLRNAMTKITGPQVAEGTGQAGQADKVDGVVAAGEQLRDYFDQHRIYLDEALCRKLQSLQTTFFDAWIKHSFAVAKDQYVRQNKSATAETWKKLGDELPVLLQDIEQEFRAMLTARQPR